MTVSHCTEDQEREASEHYQFQGNTNTKDRSRKKTEDKAKGCARSSSLEAFQRAGIISRIEVEAGL